MPEFFTTRQKSMVQYDHKKARHMPDPFPCLSHIQVADASAA